MAYLALGCGVGKLMVMASSSPVANSCGGASRQNECVGQFMLADFLCGIGDADGLLVHTDKEGVGLAASALNQIGAFAAAQIQMKAGERDAANWRASRAPISDIGLGVRLNRIGVAL